MDERTTAAADEEAPNSEETPERSQDAVIASAIDPSVSEYFAFQRSAALWLCISVVVVFIATTFLVGFINRN